MLNTPLQGWFGTGSCQSVRHLVPTHVSPNRAKMMDIFLAKMMDIFLSRARSLALPGRPKYFRPRCPSPGNGCPGKGGIWGLDSSFGAPIGGVKSWQNPHPGLKFAAEWGRSGLSAPPGPGQRKWGCSSFALPEFLNSGLRRGG